MFLYLFITILYLLPAPVYPACVDTQNGYGWDNAQGLTCAPCNSSLIAGQKYFEYCDSGNSGNSSNSQGEIKSIRLKLFGQSSAVRHEIHWGYSEYGTYMWLQSLEGANNLEHTFAMTDIGITHGETFCAKYKAGSSNGQWSDFSNSTCVTIPKIDTPLATPLAIEITLTN